MGYNSLFSMEEEQAAPEAEMDPAPEAQEAEASEAEAPEQAPAEQAPQEAEAVEAAPSPGETEAAPVQEEAAAEPAPAVAEKPKRAAQSRRGTRRKVEHVQTPKAETIARLRKHDRDVGSTEVQVGLLTDRILHLTEHLKVHRKDKHTNHGLRMLVSKRKRLLKYLEANNPDSFRDLKAALNLR